MPLACERHRCRVGFTARIPPHPACPLLLTRATHCLVMHCGTAKDQYKMQTWNSFPSLFQNTIFHAEQVACLIFSFSLQKKQVRNISSCRHEDPQIKKLRQSGTLDEKLQRAKQLKEEGNALLKSAGKRTHNSSTKAQMFDTRSWFATPLQDLGFGSQQGKGGAASASIGGSAPCL